MYVICLSFPPPWMQILPQHYTPWVKSWRRNLSTRVHENTEGRHGVSDAWSEPLAPSGLDSHASTQSIASSTLSSFSRPALPIARFPIPPSHPFISSKLRLLVATNNSNSPFLYVDSTRCVPS